MFWDKMSKMAKNIDFCFFQFPLTNGQQFTNYENVDKISIKIEKIFFNLKKNYLSSTLESNIWQLKVELNNSDFYFSLFFSKPMLKMNKILKFYKKWQFLHQFWKKCIEFTKILEKSSKPMLKITKILKNVRTCMGFGQKCIEFTKILGKSSKPMLKMTKILEKVEFGPFFDFS